MIFIYYDVKVRNRISVIDLSMVDGFTVEWSKDKTVFRFYIGDKLVERFELNFRISEDVLDYLVWIISAMKNDDKVYRFDEFVSSILDCGVLPDRLG